MTKLQAGGTRTVDVQWTPEAREKLYEVRRRVADLLDEIEREPGGDEAIARLSARLRDVPGGFHEVTPGGDFGPTGNRWASVANSMGAALAGVGTAFLIGADFVPGSIALGIGLLALWGGWPRESHVHSGR